MDDMFAMNSRVYVPANILDVLTLPERRIWQG